MSFHGTKGAKGSKGTVLYGDPELAGDKGQKGTIGGYGMQGSQGSQGRQGSAGAGGGAGPTGAVGDGGDGGNKGSQGSQGSEGASPAGDTGETGIGLYTGYRAGNPEWGAINAEKSNYTTEDAGIIEIILGDSATTDEVADASNYETTVRFTKKLFGVCLEDSSSNPSYSGIAMWASDYVDTI